MSINIKVYLHAKGTNFLQSGSFPVTTSDYKKDPDLTAAVVAYKWIQQIKSNFAASKDFHIVQVIYNDDIDITELVRKVIQK
ncbi:hypothetical protein [Peribacillus frigoritolerans]|uniref:hypothetical protein n=1 Tax=Peribacillus frigoritolerans TaxID=450367 RepID=UPI00207B0A38|nr:hypothetical protein [Peribacillus frigoritolerans]USK76645.1 hypothetical protein LIT31_08900 [Peribacillus frigoritolerans]